MEKPVSELSLIRDFLWIDDPWLGTSGQVKAEQFSTIAEAGFERVVNLLPDESEAYLPGEEKIVTGLGMAYERIPVLWRGPTPQNFVAFCEILDRRFGVERLYVHCAANMRVSAFVYLWRLRRGEGETGAAGDLRDIWVPDGVWAEFIESIRSAG